VGAGPGDPKLLTIRALELIREADLIVFDRLITESILKLIPERVQKIYVGKAPHGKGITQNEINRILIDEAKLGKNVVRLKGGDPLLFSRGGEEAEALRKADIDFEIVPGISSALGVPAYSGISLTHREFSSSIAIVTGHEDPSRRGRRVNWSKLASSVDTIVILMGVENLRKIAEELIAGGLGSSTPVAAIEWGTTKKQKTLLFNLEEAYLGRVKDLIASPSVIVIGEVANFAKSLNWTKSNVTEYGMLLSNILHVR
jgi:uroporphyrinogen III methyltransferase/synthase